MAEEQKNEPKPINIDDFEIDGILFTNKLITDPNEMSNLANFLKKIEEGLDGDSEVDDFIKNSVSNWNNDIKEQLDTSDKP